MRLIPMHTKGKIQVPWIIFLTFLSLKGVYGTSIEEERELGIVSLQSMGQLETRLKNVIGFQETIREETAQKDLLIKETDFALEDQINKLKLLSKSIHQQVSYISQATYQMSTQISDKNREEIPNEIISSLKKKGALNAFVDDLGEPSIYHDWLKYQKPSPSEYKRTKSSGYLQNVCDEIEKSATEIHNLVYQNSDSVWDMAKESENLAQDVYNHTYGANGINGIWDIANSFLFGDGGIKSKASYVKDQANSIKSKSSTVKSHADAIKSQAATIKSRVSNLKNDIRSYEDDSDSRIDTNKSLMQEESWKSAERYGTLLLQGLLNKAYLNIKEAQQTVFNQAQLKTENILFSYFQKHDSSLSPSYHQKVLCVQKNLQEITNSVQTLSSSCREIEEVFQNLAYFTKEQHQKFDKNHRAIMKKGSQFEEKARGLNNEVLMITQSLGMTVKDKKNQIQALKEEKKELESSFKNREEILIKTHENHISDLKDQNETLLKIEEKRIAQKEKLAQELEEENKQLKLRMSSYEKRIQEVSLKDQNELKMKMVDSMLQNMMFLLQIDMSDVKSLNVSGPELAQQCLMKIIQSKK